MGKKTQEKRLQYTKWARERKKSGEGNVLT